MTPTSYEADTTKPITITEAPFIEISKVFNAPIERVWQAWSEPELMKQWWGPEDFTSPSAKLDFQIDGKYLVAMESPAGQVIWSTGTYLEIFPHELIVCTDQFSDEKGNVISPEDAGMKGDWSNDPLVFSVKFEALDDNRTKIHLVHEGIPVSEHDDCVSGWNSSLDKMKNLLEKH
jgi:uncharacterized protein YndB with AHSA1/START domain